MQGKIVLLQTRAVVFYVTTDVYDAEVAAKHHANFAPRLADALPRDPLTPDQPRRWTRSMP